MGKVAVKDWRGAEDADVTALAYQSSSVERGSLFCTWKGHARDGHEFIPDAIERGAVAVVAENPPSPMDCVYIQVPSGRVALSRMAANFYEHPAKKLQMVGITGTNGKTSTAFLLQHLLNAAGRKSGLLGTVGYDLGNGIQPSERTTPEGLDIQTALSAMVENDCRAGVMEVSSHAIEQGRVEGIPYAAAVFTNLSQDHLDYHGTMENYFGAKLPLFARLEKGQTAVLNADDPVMSNVRAVLADGVRVISFGVLSTQADFRAESISYSSEGTAFQLQSPEGVFDVKSRWLGAFGVSNLLAGLAAGYGLGLSIPAMLKAGQPTVPGRMEVIPHDGDFTVVVDYAHTEDALRKALEALQPLCQGTLRVLIGCGGNRDRTKRPLMARAACELASAVVLTSDNPRNENPAQILNEMTAGVSGFENFEVVEDRRSAIAHIIQSAQAGDMVLIAGKGHEAAQEIRGVKHPFSDQTEARQVLQLGGVR